MATEVEDMSGGGQPKAAVLLIVGEPFSEEDKTLLLEEIVKGFRGWDALSTGVDINNELAQIANRASQGEEGPDDVDEKKGERVIRHRSDNIAVEVLVNPQSQTVKDSLKAVLSQLSPAKAVIYAGYTFQGTPAWVTQDDLFSFNTFNQVFRDPSVENALKQMDDASLLLYTGCPADWAAALKGSEAERRVKVAVNPKDKLDNVHGLLQFSAYVQSFLRAPALSSLLQASDVVGNISFTRPVLYVFPAQQGDSALFGMKGFNMLVDGGFSRRACFWDFVRHLDGIDAMLVSHLGPDNLFGLRALLNRKALDSLHPEISFMLMNAPKAVNGGPKSEDASSGLVINLAAEGNRLAEMSRKLGQAPHPLTRPLSSPLEPINLFHKVGKGSLDMYVLNPVADSKELKDMLSQWGKQAPSFSQSNGIPVPNCASVCALLVVRPANPSEKVTRILFPGTAPQHKLLEGLERVKHLEFLKHPSYCASDSHKPKKAAPSAGGSSRVSSATHRSATTTTSARTTTKAEPPKRLETSRGSPRASASATSTASAKLAKEKKESNNKRVSSAKEKVRLDEREKEDKSKSSTSSSPSKASVKSASPAKTPSSPSKTPATVSPDDIPAMPISAPILAPEPPAPEPAINQQPSPISPQDFGLDNHMAGDGSDLLTHAPAMPDAFPIQDNRMADSPEALPEPERFGSDVDFAPPAPQQDAYAMSEREKLRAMGIYDDDDDDEGMEDGFDNKENSHMHGGAGGTFDHEDEEVRPQPLPEPVAEVETPSSAEPDLIQDTFSKPSAMEQSQIFEDGIEADYGAEGDYPPQATEPQAQDLFDMKPAAPFSDPMRSEFPEAAMAPNGASNSQEDVRSSPETEQMKREDFTFTEYAKETSPDMEKASSPHEESPEPAHAMEVSPDPCDVREISPDPHDAREQSPAFDDDVKEVSPDPHDAREQSPAFDDDVKEVSPDPHDAREQSPAFDDDVKEVSPDPHDAREQSPAFDDDVKEVSPDPHDAREQSPTSDDDVKEVSPDPHDAREQSPASDDDVKEVCPVPAQAKEMSPEFEERECIPADGDLQQVVPDQEEQGFSDKEPSPDPQDQFGEDPKEQSPAPQEAGMAKEDDSNIIQQNIQYGMANDNGFQMGGIREEEEEEEDEEEEAAMEKDDIHGLEEIKRVAPAEAMQQHAVEEMGTYDSHGQEAGKAGDFGESEKDSYVYEKDVNLEDEEVHMGGSHRACLDDNADNLHYEQQASSIPAAFEKDETPTPAEKRALVDPEVAQVDSGREDTDSIDGGTPDDDKDIDEILAQQQLQQATATTGDHDDLMAAQMAQQEMGTGGGNNFNPFIGLNDEQAAVAGAGHKVGELYEDDSLGEGDKMGAEFDPLAQWGPPTGLPAPAPPLAQDEDQEDTEVDALQEHTTLEPHDAAQHDHGDLNQLEDVEKNVEYKVPCMPDELAGQMPSFMEADLALKTERNGGEIHFAGSENSSNADPAEFDPLAEWGSPMGLPSPPPPQVNGKSPAKSGAGDTKKTEAKKPAASALKAKAGAEKRPTSATKSASRPVNGTADPPKSARSKPEPRKAALDTSRTSKLASRPASGKTLDSKATESKARPASGAARKSRASPEAIKMPALPPFTPFYMDLTYIPNHGDPAYLDGEFFRRVRARYYVLSSRNPNPKVLEMLLAAKAGWEHGADTEVTVIPTYETEVLQHWLAANREDLDLHKVVLAPAASRCTVRLQDHEDSCYTYRLEF